MTTLQEIKKSRGLTNAAIGRAIGVSASVAGMVLQGRHIRVYHDEQIQKLADVLGITFERCWFAMCESYNQFMGTPGREHQRADEVRYEVQIELKAQTGLNVPVEEPRQLATVDGTVIFTLKAASCQHVLDEGDHGEILCNKPASNQCRDCKEWFCDEHFNEFMNLCDVDSEVEAAKHI